MHPRGNRWARRVGEPGPAPLAPTRLRAGRRAKREPAGNGRLLSKLFQTTRLLPPLRASQEPSQLRTFPLRLLFRGKLLFDLERNDIVAHAAELEAKAKRKLLAKMTAFSSTDQTVCFMWKSTARSWDDYGSALSGGGSGVKSLTADKLTVCAEDNMLRHDKSWAFSLAYDRALRWKPACSKGCAALLDKYGITDLYY